jgi:hypothetical protein
MMVEFGGLSLVPNNLHFFPERPKLLLDGWGVVMEVLNTSLEVNNGFDSLLEVRV